MTAKGKKKVIIAVMGHPFTGKTTVAVAIANWLKCAVLLVDEIIDGIPPLRKGGEEISWINRRERLYTFALRIMGGAMISHLRPLRKKQIAMVIDFPFFSRSHLDRFIKSIKTPRTPPHKIWIVIIECNVQNKYAWQMRFEEEHHHHHHPDDERYWYKPRCWEQVQKVISSSEYIPDACFENLQDYYGCVTKLVIDPYIDLKLTDLLYPPEGEIKGVNQNPHISLFYEAIQQLISKTDLEKSFQMKGPDQHDSFFRTFQHVISQSDDDESSQDNESDEEESLSSSLSGWTDWSLKNEAERRGLCDRPPVVEFRQWRRSHRISSRKQRECTDHSLTRYEQDGLCSRAKCAICHLRINYAATYACEFCSLVLHKSCAEFPVTRNVMEKATSFNPVALVKLSPNQGWIYDFLSEDDKLPCNSCATFSYSCQSCVFSTHIRNPRVPTIIRHEGHEHFLSIRMDPIVIGAEGNTASIYRCAACGLPGVYGSYYCLICDVHYHCECANLPPKLECRHVGYNEPLMLMVKSPEEREDYLCDVCDKKRDPECWFYYCDECDYATHTFCVVDYPTYIFDLTFSGFA